MKNKQPSQKTLFALMLATCMLPATVTPALATTDAAMMTSANRQAEADKNRVTNLTLLQTGDIHGHMIPRPCLRCDDEPMLGGLAYMYTKIQQVRATNANTLLFNTGDTIQGSAEALFTKGQALVDVLDQFGYDGYAPGNWDYVYGIDRFLELFGNNRWGGVAANVYYDEIVYPEKAGQTLLPPYRILTVDGVKIGLLGLSSERAINALGPWVTKGIKFTSDGAELPGYIDTLRNTEKVDLIFLVSEFGLAKNVYFGENYDGIDVIMSSDMHEETPEPVVTRNGTIVTEVGQDGTRLGQLDLKLKNGKIVKWDYTFHTIDTRKIKPDAKIAAIIKNERKEFVASKFFKTHVNPFNGALLKTPIDTVVGTAEIGLHRSNFTDTNMSASVEGTSSDFLADAFKTEAGADVGQIRGFRYGTNIKPGPIKLEDLYHFMPIGAQIANVTVTGQALKNQLEGSANGSFNPDVFAWTGGWLNGYSGLKFDLDVYASQGKRIQNLKMFNRQTGAYEPIDPTASYVFAGYWYAQNPLDVGGVKATTTVTPIKGANGETLDATELVVNYLKTHTANPELNRINLVAPLPAPVYGNREEQPLKGVSTAY
ncbi:MAG TPA: 5'-nucleotidase C-terminal domain-containing protein [Thiobacillus sp.]|nr:5'-nucleotidase C-terminal domain-containing protein [Thiobacillus sp.]HQT71193.1 5'-nucleotidase C-terminal domain-containing protein [Thiobacillus sp.]